MSKKGYYKDKNGWHGKTKWNCEYCNFDSLSEETMKKHIRERHTKAPKKKPQKQAIYDRFGNPLLDSKGNILYKEIK